LQPRRRRGCFGLAAAVSHHRFSAATSAFNDPLDITE